MRTRERKKLQQRLATRKRNRLNGDDDRGLYAQMEFNRVATSSDLLRAIQRYATLYTLASERYHNGTRNSDRHRIQINIAELKIKTSALNFHTHFGKDKPTG